MSNVAYAFFALVSVISVFVLFFSFPVSDTGMLSHARDVSLDVCKYECAVSLNSCREQALEAIKECARSRNVCADKKRKMEMLCNDNYWKCRAACAQPLGAGLVEYRRA